MKNLQVQMESFVQKVDEIKDLILLLRTAYGKPDLIGEKQLSIMKPTAYLINAARAE